VFVFFCRSSKILHVSKKSQRMLVHHNFVGWRSLRPKVNTFHQPRVPPRQPSLQHIPWKNKEKGGSHFSLRKKRCFTRKNPKNISPSAKLGGSVRSIYSNTFFFHPTVIPTSFQLEKKVVYLKLWSKLQKFWIQLACFFFVCKLIFFSFASTCNQL